MENRAGAYARFFALRGAKVVANNTGCDVHGDGVDATVKDDAAIVIIKLVKKCFTTFKSLHQLNNNFIYLFQNP